MFHSRWYRCTDHNTSYPAGAVCPKCNVELTARNKEALKIDWRSVVPIEAFPQFIHSEQLYCRDEEHEFYSYGGNDTNEKEKRRTAVLEKRAEFLKMYIQITIKTNEELLDVYKPQSSN